MSRDLAAIADEIEQGGWGRDLDADIYEAFGCQVKRAPEGRNSISWRWLEDGRWIALEHLTTSIDECSRFIEKRRPAWAWTVSNIGPNDEPHACVTLGDEACTDIEGSAIRSAMALAAALCRAEAKEREQ
jgi:hypothetical protein